MQSNTNAIAQEQPMDVMSQQKIFDIMADKKLRKLIRMLAVLNAAENLHKQSKGDRTL